MVCSYVVVAHDSYGVHPSRLHLEFPELVAAAEKDAGDVTICEVGCGNFIIEFFERLILS